jgi:hypothetical protein
MTKKAKKKAAPKMKEVVKQSYLSMTEEQYDEIKSILRWDNPHGEFESLASESDLTLVEMAFKIGKISKSFELMCEKIEKILEDSLTEQEDTQNTYDWDNSEDDYEDVEEDDEDEEEEDEE